MFADICTGLISILTPETIGAVALGIFTGLMFGAIPGISGIMAISIPHVLSGTYVAESVFNYPGIGLLAVSSAKYHDYNLLMLMVLITGAMVMLSSLAAQAVNEVIDPRMKSSNGVVC